MAASGKRNTARAKGEPASPPPALRISLYLVAFITGAIVMGFEMLGSRYLGPYFGSGIYTWAALISTVLAALCAGYFAGGMLADRHPSVLLLGAIVIAGSAYLVLLPAFAGPVLDAILQGIDDIKTGSLVSSFAIMFVPVVCFGMYSPFAIRLLLPSRQNSGIVSGTVYGVSTAGSIVGTLGTTFFLIPLIGSRAITFVLGISGIVAGLALVLAAFSGRRRGAALVWFALICVSGAALFAGSAKAEEPFDAAVRARMLQQKNGLIAHEETVYNDIFVSKEDDLLTMSFQWKGFYFTESQIDLKDPDDLPMLYPRAMTIAAIYPREIKRVLIIGLGGGALPTYLGRFLPGATIDSVELDSGVIDAARKYFGMRETERSKLIASDGRVFLTRHKERYDLILVDAFTGSYIPFHLMTKEFYELLRDRLTPDGAVAFNITPGTKLYDSNLRTLQAVFSHIDLFSSDKKPEDDEVIAIAALGAPADGEALAQKAAVAQARYKFRFDVTKLVAARRMPFPAKPKGDVLTDDFAPVNLYDSAGRHYRRKQ